MIATFGYALKPSGCLLLGTSESLGSQSEHFGVLDSDSRIYCLKANLTRSVFDLQDTTAFTDSNSRPLVVERVVRERKNQVRPESGALRNYVDQVMLTQYAPSGFVVNSEYRIVELRGDVKRFIGSTRFLDPYTSDDPAELNYDLFAALREEFRDRLRAALEKARNYQSTVRVEKVGFREQDRYSFVNIVVIPTQAPETEMFFLVLFETSELPSLDTAPLASIEAAGAPGDAESRDHIIHLEQELLSTRQYLQAIIEELRSTNEEAQSSNEELQSSNEELQTAKEELQSSNEELNTINAELQSRNLELATVNDDLVNLFSSMNMAIIMLDKELRVRRFTPTAEKVLRLIPGDIGRSILDLQPRIKVQNLESILRGVLESLTPYEEEVQDQGGGWHILRVRPYRTSDNRIDGAVLHLLDVGELKKKVEEAKRARDYAEIIVNTVRQPLLVIDRSLVVKDTNRSFEECFRVPVTSVVGKNVSDIDQGLFSPALRGQLKRLLMRVPPSKMSRSPTKRNTQASNT